MIAGSRLNAASSRISFRRFPGRNKDSGQFVSFAKQSFDSSLIDDLGGHKHLQPES